MPFENYQPQDAYGMYEGGPQNWQQQQLNQMQPGMYPMRQQMNRWPRYVAPGSPEMMTMTDPGQQVWMQGNGQGVNVFASHYNGGPMHQVHNIHRMPPAYRMQYAALQQQIGRRPVSPAAYFQPRTYNAAMYQWGGEQQPWNGWQGNYGPGTQVTYGRRGARTVAPYPTGPRTPSRVGGRVMRVPGGHWGPEAEQETGTSIMGALQQMQVLGMPIRLQGVGENFAQRYGIPPSRVPEHIDALRDMAARLEQAARQRGFQGGQPWSDGIIIGITGQGGETIVATPTQVLFGRGSPRQGTWQSIDGGQVQWSQRPTGDQYVGRMGRIVELRDGRILWEQGGASLFYDGDRRSPRIIRVSGGSAAVQLDPRGGGQTVQLGRGTHIVGEGGIVSHARPNSPEAAQQYLREVALRLRTPEAIGAFVSSYMTVEDSSARGGRRDASLATVNFQSEPQGQQDIQSAVRTIMMARGDCEDFAILAAELMQLAGHPCVVARQSSNHYVCAFLERTPNGGYVLCKIDTGGFQRVPRVFRSGAEAMAALWSGRERSGVEWEISHPQGMDNEALSQARRVAGMGGGLSVIDVSSITPDGRARINYIAFGETDWDRLVYRPG